MPSAQTPVPIEIPMMGLRKDIPPMSLGFGGLVDAENWIYRDARFFIRPGLTDFGDDIDQRPMGFRQFDIATEEDRLVMGTVDSWFHYNSGAGTWTDLDLAVNPLTGGATAQVVFRTFEVSGTVYLIGVNGADAPKVWPGAGGYADLAGAPPATASTIAVSADRVLMASGDVFYYSAHLDHTDWTAAGVPIADTPGDIVAMMEFGNKRTAIYKESSIYMAYSQVDLLYKFDIELVRAGIPGPVSPNAVFPIGELGIHCYLSENGALVLFDGNAPVSLGDHIQTHIRATRDYDLRARSWGFYDSLQNDIYVFYANKGASDVNCCVVVNFDTRTLHYYTFGGHTLTAGHPTVLTDSVAVGELGILDSIALTFGEMDRGQTGILLGDVGGQIYQHKGTTDDGAAIPAYFETGIQMFGEARRFTVLNEAEHLFPTAAATQNVSLSFGKSDYGETRVLQSPQTFNIGGGGPYRTQHRLPGRLYSVRMNVSASYAVEWLGSLVTHTETGLR